ncbi:M23 family metallopeptidase [Paenibacillus sp. 1A_MP2]|uniref:M23 family metallopeptidase n=1 Tax=Paenibacillus sp. 1A_MP2 TaxID=3457495 RepID=UPI003FCDD93D
MVSELVPVISTQSVWVDESSNGIYNGSTEATAQDICFPIKGKTLITTEVTDEFGAPRKSASKIHRGIDLWEQIGTPILAAWAGKVVRISRNKQKVPVMP